MINYYEFEQNISLKYINEFKKIFHFFKKNAIDEDSWIRKLHLGYTCMKESSFDKLNEEFSWLENFRKKYKLQKKLNFLETIGLDNDKNTFKPHIDGDIKKPSIMFNVPIQNCNMSTTTYWVESEEYFEPILSSNNGRENSKKKGSTPHIPDNIKYKIIDRYNFTDRCVLFKSDTFHMVKNNSLSMTPRIVMHWWMEDYIEMDEAIKIFNDIT